MKKKLLAAILALTMAISLGGCKTSESKGASEPAGSAAGTSEAAGAKSAADVSIILVTMDGLDNHWVNVNKGAEAAAKELGCKYQWMAPDKKDTALQIEMLNNAVAAKCDGLVVAAVDPDAITSTLEGAAKAGVKIVYADSTAKFDAVASYTTDNYAAAKKAGEQMIKGLKEKGITSGNIGIVAFSNATQTSIDREKGFRDAFEGSPYKLLETQYGNSEVAASQAAAENFISQGVVGLYGNNEPGAVGVGDAVAANKSWKGVAIGFDASETTLDLVENGSLYSIIAQEPYKMGYGAVTAAFHAVQGKDIGEKKVDTGSTVVTKENTGDFRAK
ncbi:MAG TPA: BMP family ABC transporter substrate-binding protein [Ruminococcaceae bacterium]|jgi:ribose transport system substrate-binding protein|nr:BMP family ABC transporter substrate-binding protein [Oscillospiraceae bacterium]